MTKIIEVHKPFLLNLQDGRKIHFALGQHEVAHCIADHWWTKEHASVVEDKVEVEAENTATETPVNDPAADLPVAVPVAPAATKSKKKSKAKSQEVPQPEAQ